MASIERLETRLQSRQIMYSHSSSTLRRGGSEIVQAQPYASRRVSSAPTNTLQGPCITSRHYNNPNTSHYPDNSCQCVSHMPSCYYNQSVHQQIAEPHHNQYQHNSINSEFEQPTETRSYRSTIPPNSPGPPPPPPSTFQQTGHAQHSLMSPKAGRQIKKVQSRKMVKKMENYQACHIMQKKVSYAYLRHKENKARQKARLRKVKVPALGSSPLEGTQSLERREDNRVAGTHGKMTVLQNENIPPGEKDAAVLVNQNNLHLLLSPGGRK